MKKQEIMDSITGNALKALCDRYDEQNGMYPEYGGDALYRFFKDMENSIHAKEKKNPLIINKYGVVKQFCCKEIKGNINAYAIGIFEDYETGDQSVSLKLETMDGISFFDECPYCKADIFVQIYAELWEE